MNEYPSSRWRVVPCAPTDRQTDGRTWRNMSLFTILRKPLKEFKKLCLKPRMYQIWYYRVIYNSFLQKRLSIVHYIILLHCDIWCSYTGDSNSTLLGCYVMYTRCNITEELSFLQIYLSWEWDGQGACSMHGTDTKYTHISCRTIYRIWTPCKTT